MQVVCQKTLQAGGPTTLHWEKLHVYTPYSTEYNVQMDASRFGGTSESTSFSILYHIFTGQQVALASLTVCWTWPLWYMNTSEACIYFPGAPLSRSSACNPQQGCDTQSFVSVKFAAWQSYMSPRLELKDGTEWVSEETLAVSSVS